MGRTVVTGASSGIGRALCVELASRGRRVVAVARRAGPLRELAAGHGGVITVHVSDVGQASRWAAELRALDDAEAIDVVVANAGVGADPAFAPSSWEAIADACHINFCGAASTLTALFPRMVARGAGQLVGIGSLAALGALPLSAAYCSPKAGLAMLLECLRLDAQDTGVGVTNVHLGFVDTPMLAHAKHPTPQKVPAAEAARVIADAIDARRDTVVYPRALGLVTRAAAALPTYVRARLARAGSRYR